MTTDNDDDKRGDEPTEVPSNLPNGEYGAIFSTNLDGTEDVGFWDLRVQDLRAGYKQEPNG